MFGALILAGALFCLGTLSTTGIGSFDTLDIILAGALFCLGTLFTTGIGSFDALAIILASALFCLSTIFTTGIGSFDALAIIWALWSSRVFGARFTLIRCVGFSVRIAEVFLAHGGVDVRFSILGA